MFRALLLLTTAISHAIWAKSLPEPLTLVTSQGADVVDTFEAPAGMTGYVIDFRGNALTVYVTGDEQYLLTGKMIDAQGNDVGESALSAYVTGPKSDKDWQRLENSHWIQDGNTNAPRIIYTFTDPNCPYCRKFWQEARPWVESGEVQIRHILVGILKADSVGKAAAIIESDNPADTLYQHQSGAHNQLSPLSSFSNETRNALQDNLKVMRSVGVSATPATFYKNTKGVVKLQMGLPPSQQMAAMMEGTAD